MNLKTFQAPTMAEALAQVKNSLGSEALILHTRTFRKNQWMGLRKREIVEITAGHGAGIGNRPTRRPLPHPYNRDIRSAPAPASSPPAPDMGRQLLQMPGAQSAVMAGVSQEINELKTIVKELVVQTRARNSPNVPEELFDHYLHLIGNQVAEDLAMDIIKTVQSQVRPEHFKQKDFIRGKMADQLEKLIPSAGGIRRTKTNGAHVVALIGPTGVGKTTTIAKLAAHLKLRERRRVGLITIDTYRIAAVDQLRRYAEILDAPLRAVASADELRSAVASMADCEYVLIDTAGRSPNDVMKLSELKTFLAAAAPDEVHLVLSTTASQACVELAVSRFAEVRVDRIIFTKLDEAAHLGVVLNVARKLNKSLSYITTGQDVPDDIEVSKASRLAQMILGGKV
jgi:flagellar biosynthesis protein FlhF